MLINTPSLRYATVTDAPMMAEAGARLFAQTFAADNDPDDMADYLAESFALSKVEAELADPARVTLLLMVDDQLVGYAQLLTGEAPSSVSGVNPIELVRIYVDQAQIGQGLGAQLMQACHDEAQHQGHQTMWLGVWQRNPRAIQFYERWGFTKVGTHTFRLGSDEQTDWIMEKALDDRC